LKRNEDVRNLKRLEKIDDVIDWGRVEGMLL
jgi:hypothetical protein